MDHIDVVIVGAGVVGLALAREVALSGKSALIIEKQSSFGMATSSRNSEVIHAGIYYPQDSLKARYCIEGNCRLYAFAKERDIAYKKSMAAPPKAKFDLNFKELVSIPYMLWSSSAMLPIIFL